MGRLAGIASFVRITGSAAASPRQTGARTALTRAGSRARRSRIGAGWQPIARTYLG
jgi:hypothetical protein